MIKFIEYEICSTRLRGKTIEMNNHRIFQHLQNYKEYRIDITEKKIDKYVLAVNIVKKLMKQHNETFVIDSAND